MTFVPHFRLTLSGDMPGGEIFSCNLSLRQAASGTDFAALMGGAPNDTVWDDIAADCSTFWGSAGAHINNACVLKRVTIAEINEEGRYAQPAIERAVNTPGEWVAGSYSEMKPNSLAVKVTLHTAADLGRVKGGFYIPMVGYPIQGDGLYLAADAEAIEGAAETFINNLGNQPGLDALDIRVVVASQGRFNYDSNGNRTSTRVPPGNHDVTAVSVGRRPDVQRRRANRLPELRSARTVNQV